MTGWNEGFRTFRLDLQVTGSEIMRLSMSSSMNLSSVKIIYQRHNFQ